MTLFNRREQSLETQFAHEEELKFRARERAVKALSRCASVRFGKSGEAVEAYGNEVVADDVTHPTAEQEVERVAETLGIRKIEIRRMMDQFLATAEVRCGAQFSLLVGRIKDARHRCHAEFVCNREAKHVRPSRLRTFFCRRTREDFQYWTRTEVWPGLSRKAICSIEMSWV